MGRSKLEGREECTVSPAIVWGCTYLVELYHSLTHSLPPLFSFPPFLSLPSLLHSSACLSLHLPSPFFPPSIAYKYQVHTPHDNNTSVRKLCALNSHSTEKSKQTRPEQTLLPSSSHSHHCHHCHHHPPPSNFQLPPTTPSTPLLPSPTCARSNSASNCASPCASPTNSRSR